jgi:methanogenic corrinoid protein MtbC1
VTEVVRAKLASLLNGTITGTRGRIVLACVPEERHECGLLALAVLLHAEGWQVVYLGADTPLENAFELAAALDADAIGLSATLEEHAEQADSELARLASSHPNVRVVKGGRAWNGGSPSQALEQLGAAAAGARR